MQFEKTGKYFFEDSDPAPLMHFYIDPQTGDYKAEKLRNLLPRTSLADEFGRLPQKDRD